MTQDQFEDWCSRLGDALEVVRDILHEAGGEHLRAFKRSGLEAERERVEGVGVAEPLGAA
jgi:hypothetical protein